MLLTSYIPQYQGESHPVHWQRFIDKAAKGSCKAVEMFQRADLAYMVALTGDPTALDPLDRYDALFSERFPGAPPARTAQELLEVAVCKGYYPQAFTVSAEPLLAAHAYRKLWARRTSVPCKVLMNDAVLHCFSSWSPQLCLDIHDADFTDYESLAVVSGMLALCFTWPGIEK